MKVQEIMSKDVTWVGPEMLLKDAAKKMRDDDVGCLPVGKADKLVGMITDRDITCRAVAEGSIAKSRVADAMSKGVTYCFDDQDVKEAAQLMETKQIHRLPVLNRQKRMVGIVSLGDLAVHAPHELTGEVVEAVSRHVS
jgi:CBS domain-containing protein